VRRLAWLRPTRTVGEEVFNRCTDLPGHQFSAERLSPCHHLIDRPQDDRVTCVLDDHFATLSKAVLLPEFGRQDN
jgi:hypothetical protein